MGEGYRWPGGSPTPPSPAVDAAAASPAAPRNFPTAWRLALPSPAGCVGAKVTRGGGGGRWGPG